MPVLERIERHPGFTSSVIASDMHLVPMFGGTIGEVARHASRLYTVETTMASDSRLARAKSIGVGILGVSEVLDRIRPDLFVVLGDRGEVLGATMCAVELNIPVVHLFGGDVCQGGVDEPVRHAITKLASVHLTSNRESADRVRRMGEEPWRVHVVGSPVLDLIRLKRFTPPARVLARLNLDPKRPIVVLLQHSVTWQVEDAERQIRETMASLEALGHQTVAIYPCSDPGYSAIVRVLREYTDRPWLRVLENLPHQDFLGLLSAADVFVGNSSGGLMETPSFRLPFVNVGSRQEGRLRADNVIDVPHDRRAITRAIQRALGDRRFQRRVARVVSPYGDGHAARAIVTILKALPLDGRLIAKRMTY